MSTARKALDVEPVEFTLDEISGFHAPEETDYSVLFESIYRDALENPTLKAMQVIAKTRMINHH